MRRLVAVILIIGWRLFLPSGTLDVRAADSNKQSLAGGQPIEISADRLEAYEEKRMIIFSGHAVATQAERVIKADKIIIYYKKDKSEAAREGLKNVGKTGDLDRIEAQGQVFVSQGDRIVTGEKAVYYQDAQKIVMTGDAVMKQAGNIVRGDKIEVFLNENKGVVEGSDSKKVKATIFPVEKKTAP